jgi:pimeloyl-ACP methyl ester carboxylesterase
MHEPPRELALSDGRKLAYDVYGAPDGFPVLNCHGGLVCRLDVETAADAARGLGICILSPDRPGVGGSDRKPGHSTLDWTDDVAELLAVLGVDRFGCMGWSMGGQYCAAVAYRFPERVTKAALIAGCPPLDVPERFKELNRMDRRLAKLSLRAPALARTVFVALRTGHRVIERYEGLPPRAIAEGLRDSSGVVDEYRAFVAPWGFGPEDIRVPVDVWQGTADRLVPGSWANELVRRIPHGRLRLVADEGHMIAVTRRADVLRELIA